MKKFGLGAKNMDVELNQNSVLTNQMSGFMKLMSLTHIKLARVQSWGLFDLQMATD